MNNEQDDYVATGSALDLFFKNLIYSISGCSAVGSALGLGPRCRGFESLHSDHKDCNAIWHCSLYFCIELILICDILNKIKRPLGLGYTRDRILWMMKGETGSPKSKAF